MMKPARIAPSILAADFARLGNEIRRVEPVVGAATGAKRDQDRPSQHHGPHVMPLASSYIPATIWKLSWRCRV